jgi:hypothetical protein
MARFAVKAVTDFTGIVQFRGAGEMGGAMWLWSQFAALVTSFVATRIYLSSERNNGVLAEGDVWKLVCGLSGAWIGCFGIFLLLMKKKFWGTFVDTTTGKVWAQNRFVRGRTDESKKSIVEFNVFLWADIRDDVKDWIHRDWEKWEEERPAWFTDAWRGFVDNDMVPPDRRGGVKRRKSSIGEQIHIVQ